MGEVCKLMRMVLMGNFKKALQGAPYADTAVMEQQMLPASHTYQFAWYKRKGLQKAAGLMCSPHTASPIVTQTRMTNLHESCDTVLFFYLL